MRAMRLPAKMYFLIFVGITLTIYQYSLSTAVSFDDGAAEVPIPIDIVFPPGFDKAAVNETFNLSGNSSSSSHTSHELKTIYVVTPTYRRPEQIAELTRMSHTLRLVPNVKWLVVEDAKATTSQVTELLRKSGLPHEHLLAPMPEEYRRKKKGPKPRGVSNRNKGLEWIRKHATSGVFYFADDDNTYDLELFEEIRQTKKVSMFPVGLITKLGVSSPVVRNGVFTGFYDGWMAGRKFPVDMAGFAVSVPFLLQRPNASMPYKPGYEEDGFLKSLHPFEPKEIELLAGKCTKILVWHTQTKKNEPSLAVDLNKYNSTNIIKLKRLIV